MGNTLSTISDEQYRELGKMTDGYSGADIGLVVRDALMQPVRRVQTATHFRKVSKREPWHWVASTSWHILGPGLDTWQGSRCYRPRRSGCQSRSNLSYFTTFSLFDYFFSGWRRENYAVLSRRSWGQRNVLDGNRGWSASGASGRLQNDAKITEHAEENRQRRGPLQVDVICKWFRPGRIDFVPS